MSMAIPPLRRLSLFYFAVFLAVNCRPELPSLATWMLNSGVPQSAAWVKPATLGIPSAPSCALRNAALSVLAGVKLGKLEFGATNTSNSHPRSCKGLAIGPAYPVN